jgi:hypothetical protein
VYQLFQRLGLVGVVAYTTTMVVAITVALHRLIRRWQADFTVGVLLTLVATFSLYRLYTPRPWLFTILLFVLELDLLLQVRASGKLRKLLWLPVIFALWANLHIQFIDGLLVLGIALTESILALRLKWVKTSIRAGWMGGIFVVCVLATLANPYGWRIYQVAFDLAGQFGALKQVAEFRPLTFHSPDEVCVLLLAVAAAGVLLRFRRFTFFECVLLIFAIGLSFHSQRDMWVVVIVASALLSAGLKSGEENRFRLAASAAPLVAAGTGLAVLLGFYALRVDNARLSERLAEDLPVRAVEVVKEKGWSGPLYNDFNWGGYLIWALRMPVSMDGRTNVYGDELLNRSYATWNGQPGWETDPDLNKAGLVIGPVGLPLTQLLRRDPRFTLAYEDKVAVVFVARRAN